LVSASILTILAGLWAPASASPAAIGTATANGDFLVDRAPVRGNATVLDGTVLETAAVPSLVRLEGGGRARLGAESRARMFADRVALEKGVGEISGAGGLRLEAGAISVVPDAEGSTASVAVGPRGGVTVAARTRPWRGPNREGALLARMDAGAALEFQPQAAGAAAPMLLTGCVYQAEGHYLLRAEGANLTFELRGADLARFNGMRVTVAATPVPGEQAYAGADQMIQVTQIKSLGSGCGATGSAPSPTDKDSGTRKAANGKTRAVIAGVSVAAVVGGTTLGLTRDEKTSPSPISR
jgi:hypothetical protein